MLFYGHFGMESVPHPFSLANTVIFPLLLSVASMRVEGFNADFLQNPFDGKLPH